MNSVSDKDKKVINRINKSIKALEDNDFTLYFFIVDCKNKPNSSIAYIYEMAKTLYDDGFNVKMLYQLNEEYTEAELYNIIKNGEDIDVSRKFIGVKNWLGEEYASLPHMNIATEEWTVTPSDFLFIPESLSSLMFETYKHKIPCKRYVILNDFNYVTEFIPLGVEWKNYGIYDVITTTEKQAQLIKNVFPYVNTKIIPPYISEMFRKPLKPKELIVNIITKDPDDINKIIKPFYWKYPLFKFVSFREIRNLSRETYLKHLQDGCVTVWVDEKTPFGHSPIEAIRCNNIVVGKIPEDVPEWMIDENGDIRNNGLWAYNIKDIPDLIAKAIGSWMRNEVPEEILNEMTLLNNKYTLNEWEENVVNVFEDIVSSQIKTFNDVKNNIISKTDKE